MRIETERRCQWHQRQRICNGLLGRRAAAAAAAAATATATATVAAATAAATAATPTGCSSQDEKGRAETRDPE